MKIESEIKKNLYYYCVTEYIFSNYFEDICDKSINSKNKIYSNCVKDKKKCEKINKKINEKIAKIIIMHNIYLKIYNSILKNKYKNILIKVVASLFEKIQFEKNDIKKKFKLYDTLSSSLLKIKKLIKINYKLSVKFINIINKIHNLLMNDVKSLNYIETQIIEINTIVSISILL